jgi:AP-2 complex subunit alpha
MLGSLATKELVDALGMEIVKIALQDTSRSIFVKKKALLCLLRVFRKFKDKFQTDAWGYAVSSVLENRNLGLLSSACSLIIGVVTQSGNTGFEECPPRIIKVLQRLTLQKDCPPDYLYYGTPNPWLQVKCLKILQQFPPVENMISLLNEILAYVLKHTEVTKSVNKNNADHGILFEAVNVIIHYKNFVSNELRNQAITLLGIFISVKEPNIRYNNSI